MKKILLILLFIVFSIFVVKANNLSVFNVNTSRYPLLQAKILLTDDLGNYIKIQSKDELKVFESNIVRDIINLTCPELQTSQPVSLAISLDVSGSMMTTDDGKNSRFDFGKITAQNLIQAITNKYSEFAVQVCEQKARIISDFTSDKQLLMDLIPKINGGGGTDTYEQLLNPQTGLFNIAKAGKNKKVAMLFTDAFFPAFDAKQIKECINVCSENDITFIVVIFSKKLADPNGVSKSLVSIADATGGIIFDGIITEEMALELSAQLGHITGGQPPCTIEWLTDNCDSEKNLIITHIPSNTSNTRSITIDNQLLPGLNLRFPGSFIEFGAIKPGSFREFPFSLESNLSEVMIKSIKSDNPYFTISDYGGTPPPFLLKRTDPRTIKIKFTPADSLITFGNIIFEHDGCLGKELKVKGGFPFTFPAKPNLKLLKPNGGEVIASGSYYPISWDGTWPNEVVQLDYSTDNGQSWSLVKNYVVGAQNIYNWKVPLTESNKCLMKVSQLIYKNTATADLIKHRNYVNAVKWSPDGKFIVTAGLDTSIILWDAKNSKNWLMSNYFPTGGGAYAATWSPDSKYFAVAGTGTMYQICDTNKNVEMIHNPHNGIIRWIAWSPDGKYLATVGSDLKLKLYEFLKRNVVKTVDLAADSYCCAWSPDSKNIAVASGGGAYIITFDSLLQETKTRIYETGNTLGIAWSPDSNLIAMTGQYGGIGIYNISAKSLRAITSTSYRAFYLDFSPDSKLLAVTGSDQDVSILDIASTGEILRLNGHKNMAYSVSFSPSGKQLVSGSFDRTAKIWDFGTYFQNDSSDSLWSIIAPHYIAKDIDMGKVLVGDSKDSLIKGFISNTGRVKIKIDTLIMKYGKLAFSIMAGKPPASLDSNKEHDIEFRFQPTQAGKYEDEILILIGSDTLKQKITGEGIMPLYSIDKSVIDFGKILINTSRSIKKTVLTKLSDKNLNITKTELIGFGNTPFDLLEGGGSFTLTNSENKLDVLVQFSPVLKGRYSGELKFYFENGETASVQIFGEGIAPCDSNGFTKTDFESVLGFNLVGDARTFYNMIRITPADFTKTGAVWYNKYMDVSQGFVTEFKLRISGGKNNKITDGSMPGADGFAFVIQNYHPLAFGAPGGGMCYTGINNSIAFEFDMFKNDKTQMEDFGDPDGNHFAIQSNGSLPNSARHEAQFQKVMITNILPLFKSDSSVIYSFKFDYNPVSKRLLIYCDTTGLLNKPVIVLDSVNGMFPDLAKTINLYDGYKAIIGITAATGKAFQRHDLLSWSFCNNNYYSINGIEDNQPENEVLNILPNPVSNEAKITLNLNKNEVVKITVYDQLGKEVYSIKNKFLETGFHQFNFATEGFEDGIYYSIVEFSGQRFYKQFLIIK